MADKPTVKYEVRAQRDPVNNVTIYVPAIVDRNAAKSLATVIENAIDRGLIVGGGENLQMGEGDTLKLELYEGGEPVSVLDQLQAVVSIPTAISFANRNNTSSRPDGDWWGKQVLLTATIGGEEVRHLVRFNDHEV